MTAYISPLLWLADEYLKWNPFFIYSGRDPLLHQTEIVSRILFLKPTRILVADVIGLGKTITALRILKTLERYTKLSRVLFLVPSVLVNQWIDEMRGVGVKAQTIERKTLDFLAEHSELPSGWYIGSIDTLKQAEYISILEKNDWDAIVVDEAHKLGLLGREPNRRWKNLGEIIRKKKDAVLILLSATPHKGKANDYLSRIALIDPSLLEVTNVGALDKVFDKPDYYQRTHNIIVFRRNKEDVNNVYELKEIFKPCNMLAVLIEPEEEESELLKNVTDLAVTYLGRYYSYMMQTTGWKAGKIQSILALLRTIIIKRGLSSPQALVKTFSKLVEKRGRYIELLEQGYSPEEAEEKIAQELEDYSRKLDELLTGDIGEYESELDEEFDRLASRFDKFLDESFREKLEATVDIAKRILAGEIRDSKLETLKRILRLVYQSSELPEEFKDLSGGKVIIFTEFKDTAYYLHKKLLEWAEKELGNRDAVKIFTSDNRSEIEAIKKWLAGKGERILITTDVAGEGLNLQHANILVNYEITWSPVRLEQRIGRVWRYGQRRTTYVFNLFLADALEREVAEVVFSKLYGISISLGKLEPIVGEKIFLSTIKNELLEHALEDRTVGGFIPVELEFKDKKVTLSEMRIIELVTKSAKAFVNAFIAALKKLVREIKLKRIYPSSVEAGRVRNDLRYLTGFEDASEAMEAARNIVLLISEFINAEIEEREEKILLKLKDGKIIDISKKSPETILTAILQNFEVDCVKYFVFKSDKKELFALSEVEISVAEEVRYREPVGISADFETKKLKVWRGKQLLEKLQELLTQALPVDEVYGLEDFLNQIPQITIAANSTYIQDEAREGILKIIENVRKYEDVKKLLRGRSFFFHENPRIKINEPKFIFLSSALLPEAGIVLSNEVWDWTEDESIPIVMNYEGLKGREASRVSGFEHFDVKSVKRDEEGSIIDERIIEVKTKLGKSLSVGLKREEYELARELSDKYWIYLVYGIKTYKPVILAIRNPIKRLLFQKKVAVERREEYFFNP